MMNNICPFCNKFANEDYVTQVQFKHRKKVQYFHRECFEKITRGYNNGVPKQSSNHIN